MTIEIASAIGFGAAAWLGAMLGTKICSGRARLENGPPPIKLQRWVVISVGAGVGIGLATHGTSPFQLAAISLVVVALAGCAVSDAGIGIIPDLLTLIPLGAIVISSGLQSHFGPLISACVVALPFGLAAAVSGGLGMGWGDVKLVSLGGALLGVQDAIVALSIASIVAFVSSRVLTKRASAVAFAPYLVAGMGVVLACGIRP